jgi:hypothetical protein
MVAVDELNVRAAAGTDSTSNYLLVRGAVVHVAEGPVIAEGLNWYRVASLGGAVGWVTSGWVAEPFLSTLVEDPILIRCGEVRGPVFDIVNGTPVPHDPLAIGDLALPAAAFGERALAAIELLRGTGQEACITAQLNAAGVPAVTSQLNGNACGRAVRDGAFFRLRPATGQDVPPEVQVKDPLVVHPSALTSVMVDDPMSTNLRTIADLIAAGADATGCFNVSVQGEADSVTESTSVSTDGCFIVSDQIDDVLTLARSDGGASTMLRLTTGAQSFPIGVPLNLYLSFGGSDGGSYGYVYQGYNEGCV